MATNMALKRGRKAQKRKQQVAEKRKAEVSATSLPARVLRAAQMPIQHCFVQEGLFEMGIGVLVLARGNTSYQVTVSSFLVDVFCLGIKNLMFESLSDEELSLYLDRVEMTSPLVPINPSDARKLLRDLAAWSQPLGFAPHRDYASAEKLFGDVDADASQVVFRFGRDDKPFYLPGPGESAQQIRRNLHQLQKVLGEGGFDFQIAA